MPTMRWRRLSDASRNWRRRGERQSGSRSSELVQGVRESGLLVGRLVLVDDALAGSLVELAAGRHQQLAGLVLLTGGDGLTEPADSRAKGRPHRLVAQSRTLVGENALLLRLDIGHALVPSNSRLGIPKVFMVRPTTGSEGSDYQRGG